MTIEQLVNEWRHPIHNNPEIDFDEIPVSEMVADKTSVVGLHERTAIFVAEFTANGTGSVIPPVVEIKGETHGFTEKALPAIETATERGVAEQGHSATVSLHIPHYDFNDNTLMKGGNDWKFL